MEFKLKQYSKTLPKIETFLYYVFVVLSLGTIWIAKIVLKKAFAESLQDRSNQAL